MLKNINIFVITSIFLILVLITGCGGSDNTNNSDTSIIDNKKSIYLTANAERKLTIKIDIPFNIGRVKSIKRSEHAQYVYGLQNVNNTREFYYYPEYGYIGDDSLKVKFYNSDNNKDTIIINFIIDIQRISINENKDFSISYHCEDDSTKLGSAISFDLDIVDENLNLLNKIYNDKSYPPAYYNRIVPKFSKVTSDNGDYPPPFPHTPFSVDDLTDKHHKTFENHTNDLLKISCNFGSSKISLIYPVNKDEWEAVKPYRRSYSFARNDLFFYVTYLSDLHSKIYLKERSFGNSKETAFYNANTFMENKFPGALYKPELLKNWKAHSVAPRVGDQFNHTNDYHISTIEYLSDELTNGNISLLIQKIADNYESYYYQNNLCLDSSICGTFFPEYASSATYNPFFKNGLDNWTVDKNINYPAVGSIESLPAQALVDLELKSNISNDTNSPTSQITFFQVKELFNESIEDYLLHFDLYEAYGGSYSPFGGYGSSGFAGLYVCYKDINENQIGCLTWTDHTNKFDLAWGPASNSVTSTIAIYNTRLNNVIRRVRPIPRQYKYTIDLGQFTKKFLPSIYANKETIKSIEYGAFATEKRNQSNGCNKCESKVTANIINLLKKN